MLEGEYPSLYRSSSSLSKRSQFSFFFLLGGNLILLISATASTELVRDGATSAFLLLLQLIISIAFAIALALWTPQQKWYNARALAESVKTVTWRYITKAEPYQDDGTANQLLIETLRKLLNDNRSLPLEAIDGAQITAKMREMRGKRWIERKNFYEKERIDDQLSWYKKKCTLNSKNSSNWYRGVIFLHGVAIFLLVMTLWKDWEHLWSVNILLTVAASAMAWLQTKRYQELAASYGLTAHEIDLLKSALQSINSETEFSAFVGDSENAFSREHTQWRARRDMN